VLEQLELDREPAGTPGAEVGRVHLDGRRAADMRADGALDISDVGAIDGGGGGRGHLVA
jgi:hypothetical protein